MIARRGVETGLLDAVGGGPGWAAAGFCMNLTGQPRRPLLPRYLLASHSSERSWVPSPQGCHWVSSELCLDRTA